ncbi:MAG: CinA family nicotinamide mononucleotide deamidase-related protein [Deltaproteobacteria bacterium]|nr:MAG: CinA family nicotinamide mononucleotide deamidase-related protein [Deltaproteobacteria bacterium]
MRVEIVAIGNELLNGDLADTNTARLAGWLRRQGLAVRRGQTVPDTHDAIVEAFARAAGAADLVLVTGGLGPTSDDITMEAAARFLAVPLDEDSATLERLKARFAARGYPFTPNNARQALAPRGAAVLDNPVGTAPCVRLEAPGGATFFFFPGVPRELEHLIGLHLAPWVEAHADVRPYRSILLKTFGNTESSVASKLADLPHDPRVHLAYRAHFPEIRVSFHADEPDAAVASALLAERRDAAHAALGELVFAEDEATGFVDAVAAQLLARGETLATAESCTGGLVAGMCTGVSGSSAWFLEGAVTYSNAAKTRLLGVSEALLAEHGAVSEAVAEAMALGQRERSGATWAVAVTGIAGPTGGTPDKPVGTVYFALAGPDGVRHLRRRFPFERERNRVVSAWTALDLVRRATLGPIRT